MKNPLWNREYTERLYSIESKMDEKVREYKVKIRDMPPTPIEKRLQQWARVKENLRNTFRGTDTQNRLWVNYQERYRNRGEEVNNLKQTLQSFDMNVWDRSKFHQRKMTKKEFMRALKTELFSGNISNPEVIEIYKGYLNEAKRTPYAKTPLSESVCSLYHSVKEFLK